MTATGRPRIFALISGGGTGGHVYPALALAEELVARGHPRPSVRFLGARRGLEARAVPAAGFEVELLPGRGIERRVSLRTVTALLTDVVAVLWAVVIVGRRRPSVVVGVGGFASVPGVLAAWVWRVPLVVHEQNAAPGAANRLAVRLGGRAAVGLPGTPLRGAVTTGNPVRAEIAAVRRRPDPERPLVLVVGGSLGARRLNDAALGLYDRWRGRRDVAVHHVVGERNLDACRARLDGLRRVGDTLDYTLVGYEHEMAAQYARAAIAVSRGGAIAVSELAAVGLPAVVVPLPDAPGDHQTANARALAGPEGDGGVVLPDEQCTADRLTSLLDELLADRSRLDAMGAAARSRARLDAAARLADLVEERASVA
ncbi:MAG: UDP-N-acetylglucosamine--N-acetylmuramyl-(pentapeptide) pyrophosphoryl-undecaprenol N-acetylglucosamine transferase [Acidimicrobiia bacterium]